MDTLGALLMVLSAGAGFIMLLIAGAISIYQLCIKRSWGIRSYLKLWAYPFMFIGIALITFIVRSALAVGVGGL